MQDAFAHCEALVRSADRDRFLAALFAPAEHRGALYALYAFNIEIARVREIVREPLAGEIRLQWWNDAIEGKAAGEVAANPVAAALLESVARYRLPAELLTGLIEARRFDLYDEPMLTLADFDDYARATSAALIELAARVLAARRLARPRPARASCRSRLRDRRPAAGLSPSRGARPAVPAARGSGTARRAPAGYPRRSRRRRSCARPWPSCGARPADTWRKRAGRLKARPTEVTPALLPVATRAAAARSHGTQRITIRSCRSSSANCGGNGGYGGRRGERRGYSRERQGWTAARFNTRSGRACCGGRRGSAG